MTSEFKVLARKHRPTSLLDLKGQELLVRVLSNAIKGDRLAHAFLLSGIRGIGKTTSARIIAKTINCENIQFQQDLPLPCNKCNNCLAFAAEKHPDLLEVDAASKTGVSDIRDIIDGLLYRPIMAKYKIYIIDEVHMLSTSAFNALLKTLEEPPAHVKFIFATTELRKIPMTIMSRCQKFELRRLTEENMVSHLQDICIKESVNIVNEGLLEIARLSEGSVRDALSLMDLVINSVQDGKVISYEAVKEALGLAGKEEIVSLFKSIILADSQGLLERFKNLYFAGVTPICVIEELLSLINDFTRFKLTGNKQLLLSQDSFYIDAINEFSPQLDYPRLLYLWQILFKGLRDVTHAPCQYACGEMVLVKACFVVGNLSDQIQSAPIMRSSAPDNSSKLEVRAEPSMRSSVSDNSLRPEIQADAAGEDFLSNSLPSSEIKEETIAESTSPAPVAIELDLNITKSVDAAAPAEFGGERNEGAQVQVFRDFVELFRRNGELIIHHHLISDVHLVSIDQKELVFRQKRGVPHSLSNQVEKLASDFTGVDWKVRIVANGGMQTLEEINGMPEKARDDQVLNDSLVLNVLESFKGSKVTKVSCLDEAIN